ncbi:hypothetical protein H4Q26_016725 [Puccinia striiformis f. sp. tritici PST-130]|nr:hypothetical protein H4Q26_016725 [Puccinia striiformis f. sp. tritici PST-130]
MVDPSSCPDAEIMDPEIKRMSHFASSSILRLIKAQGWCRRKADDFNESLESQLHLSTHPEKNDAFKRSRNASQGGMGAIASRRLEPNTAFHVDSESLEIHMHALRVISPGEEMTISYRDMTQTREKRQADIAHYGFQCTCAHCRMNDAQASESDRRLTRLEELSNKLVDWNEAANQVMLDEAEELLELYLLERLDNNIADGYTVAAVTYNSFGLTTRARRYATKALATGLTNFGANWEEFEPLRQLAESPEEHWSHQARMFE